MNHQPERPSLWVWLRWQLWRYKMSRQPKPGNFVDNDDIPGGTNIVHRGCIPPANGACVRVNTAPVAFAPYRLTVLQAEQVRKEVANWWEGLGFKAVDHSPLQSAGYRCFFCFTGNDAGGGYLSIDLQSAAAAPDDKPLWWCSVFVPPEAKADMLQLYPKLLRRIVAKAPRSTPSAVITD